MFNVDRPKEAPPSLASKKSYRESDVIKALSQAFHDKCYICETKEPLSLNVEHFSAHQGDPDKEYDWENLFYSCGRCNNIKNKFFNNLLDCTDSNTDVLRLIKHSPPQTPFSSSLLIEAKNQDQKTLETAQLISKVFNEDNTGNKEVTSTYLRKRVYEKYTSLIKYMNMYIDPESTDNERIISIEKIKNLMKKEQEYSAFLRWAIIESPHLFELVGDSID